MRLFNTVGPRQTGQYGMVIPNFVRQALAGQPITVFGDGTQSRSFTYVGDVVKAMVALIDEPRAVGQVFNIGNGQEISMRDLAVRIKAMTGSTSDRDDSVRSGGVGKTVRSVPSGNRVSDQISISVSSGPSGRKRYEDALLYIGNTK